MNEIQREKLKQNIEIFRKECEDYYSVSYLKTREEIDEKLTPLKNMFINIRSLNIVTAPGINLLDVHGKKLINLLEKR